MDPDLLRIVLSVPAMAFLGLVIGSFLNVVIHRLPVMVERAELADANAIYDDERLLGRVGVGADLAAEVAAAARTVDAGLSSLPTCTLNAPRSHCPRCDHRIRWFENIPVVSWLALRGRCSACGARIALRYVAVEAVTGALFAALAWRIGPSPAALAWAGFGAAVLAASVIDFETALLPDALTMPLLWAGLLAAAAGLTITPGAAILGAAAGYALPWLVATAYRHAIGRPVMAAGDYKLLSAVGAWFGWQLVAPVLLLAFVTGAVVVAVRMRRSTVSDRYIPFGPFIGVVAVAIVLADPAWVTTLL